MDGKVKREGEEGEMGEGRGGRKSETQGSGEWKGATGEGKYKGEEWMERRKGRGGEGEMK